MSDIKSNCMACIREKYRKENPNGIFPMNALLHTCNQDKRTHCDKCTSEIINGECSCGTWYDPGHLPAFPELLGKALAAFSKTGNKITSGDHHSGVCFIYFKGNYEQCMQVREYIEGLIDD